MKDLLHPLCRQGDLCSIIEVGKAENTVYDHCEVAGLLNWRAGHREQSRYHRGFGYPARRSISGLNFNARLCTASTNSQVGRSRVASQRGIHVKLRRLDESDHGCSDQRPASGAQSRGTATPDWISAMELKQSGPYQSG